MPDEAAPAESPEHLQPELERSRETAARLMENLAHKIGAIGANRTMHGAASRMQSAAHYVQEHSWEEMGAEVGRLMRSHPAYAIAAAALAGFLAGRALTAAARR